MMVGACLHRGGRMFWEQRYICDLFYVLLVMMVRGRCDDSGEVVSVNGSVFTSDKFKEILEAYRA